MIGICQEGLKNVEQALKFYNLSLEVDPNYEKAKQRILELTSN